MGLQKTLTLDSGLSATDAYIKISDYVGNKSSVTYDVKAWVSKTAADTTTTPCIWQQFFTTSYDLTSTTNILKFGYAYIKTTDDLSDATDVLDTTTTTTTS
ncbi:MAG: hypothetical protein H6Q73_208 [Firmicutes bacterium]|nr:hypothetical protein [Bacillota bacterium]